MVPRGNVIHGAGPKQSDHARTGTISRYAWIQFVWQRLDLHLTLTSYLRDNA
jgi:hypothetical protein